MNIKDALQEIVNELKNVRDLRRVPDAPPESNDQFPFCLAYPVSGSFTKNSSGWSTDLHDINIELHVTRKDLPRDFMTLVDLLDEVPLQLHKGQQANRITVTWADEIAYTFGPLEYAGVETLGVTYTMPGVKVTTTVST